MKKSIVVALVLTLVFAFGTMAFATDQFSKSATQTELKIVSDYFKSIGLKPTMVEAGHTTQATYVAVRIKCVDVYVPQAFAKEKGMTIVDSARPHMMATPQSDGLVFITRRL